MSPAGGGAAFVEPTLADWPHASWWVRATDVMWTRIGTLSEPGGYEMFGVLRFLQHVPDRDRAVGTGQLLGNEGVTLHKFV